MQFVLTEEEYKSHRQPELDALGRANSILHDLVLRDIGCAVRKGGYCDECPLAAAHRKFRDLPTDLLCDRPKNYSK